MDEKKNVIDDFSKEGRNRILLSLTFDELNEKYTELAKLKYPNLVIDSGELLFSIEEFEHHINSGAFPDGANVAAQNYNSFQTLASLQELNQFHFTIVDKFKSLV